MAGEARAVVNWLEHGRPMPTPAYPRLFERGYLAADARATVKACPLLALRLELGHGAT